MGLIPGLRGAVIDALAERPSQSVRELGEQIAARRFGSVTRQAIHLILSQLGKEGFVEKLGTRYSLSTQLIVELETLVARLKREPRRHELSTTVLQKGETRSFEVDSLLELDSRWNWLIHEILLAFPDKAPSYMQRVPHAWFSLCKFEDEVRISKLLVERCESFYTCVTGDTRLDRWLERFYSRLNSHYSYSVRFPEGNEDVQQAVLGEFIFETTYPRRHAAELRSLFGSCEELADLDLNKFLRFIGAREKMTLRLSRDKSRAAMLGKAILKNFDV